MSGQRSSIPGNWIITHDLLGEVRLIVRRSASRFIARWKDNRVVLTVPCGMTESQIMEALSELAPRLLATRHDVMFFPGQELRFDGFCIKIGVQNVAPRSVTVVSRGEGASICVGSELDFSAASTASLISRAMISAAKNRAPEVLLPRAKAIARELGCQPSAWTITSGKRILGKCSACGTVSLSYMNMFLPPELRDYIVCHELAHLSEMNHSPRFHSICDRYCGGREREFKEALRNFKWPLNR